LQKLKIELETSAAAGHWMLDAGFWMTEAASLIESETEEKNAEH
jgi:hypothetical protein